MKTWKVEFTFKAILETSGEQPDLDPFEKQLSALKGVKNLMEHTKIIKEILGMDTKA